MLLLKGADTPSDNTIKKKLDFCQSQTLRQKSFTVFCKHWVRFSGRKFQWRLFIGLVDGNIESLSTFNTIYCTHNCLWSTDLCLQTKKMKKNKCTNFCHVCPKNAEKSLEKKCLLTQSGYLYVRLNTLPDVYNGVTLRKKSVVRKTQLITYINRYHITLKRHL